MNWFSGNSSTEFWSVLLFVTLAIGFLAAIAAIFQGWKKRSMIDDAPLPQCNLQERLQQISEATLLQAKKTA